MKPSFVDRLHAEIEHLLRAGSPPLWLAGGWAIDLANGAETRFHHDIDFALPAERLDELIGALRDTHVLEALQPSQPAIPQWAECKMTATPRDAEVGRVSLDILVVSVRDGIWYFGSFPSIQMPYRYATYEAYGISSIKPEVVLLYKAVRHIAKDDHDFRVGLSRLSSSARIWLRDALLKVAPKIHWLDEL
jgi:hypothetical protein